MFTRLISFAVVTILLVFGGNQASAQPLTYGTYYDETVAGIECASAPATSCRLNFSQTPSNMLLMVSQISCYISSTRQPYALLLRVATSAGGSPISRELLFPFNPPLVTALSLYAGAVYQQNVRYLIGEGRFPYVEVAVGAPNFVATISCTIVGDLVTPLS